MATLAIDAAINQSCAAFLVRNGALSPDYLFFALQLHCDNLRRISEARGGNQSNLTSQMLKEYAIALPPMAAQAQTVAELEAVRSLIAANCELIARFERKCQAALNHVWNAYGAN